jgi:hypothetical protein
MSMCMPYLGKYKLCSGIVAELLIVLFADIGVAYGLGL